MEPALPNQSRRKDLGESEQLLSRACDRAAPDSGIELVQGNVDKCSPDEASFSAKRLEECIGVAMTEIQLSLEAASARTQGELLSLGLPDCLETRTCVPSDLWMRVEKTQQQGGLQEINLLWGLLTGVSEDVRSIIRQVAEMLDDEAEADASLRARYGVRWALAPSSDAAASLHQERLSAMKIAEDTESTHDAKLMAELEARRADVAILSRTRAELNAEIDRVASGAISEHDGPTTDLRIETEYARSVLQRSFLELQALLDVQRELVSNSLCRFERSAAHAELLLLTSSEHAAAISRLLAEHSAPLRVAVSNVALRESELIRQIKLQREHYAGICRLNPRRSAAARAVWGISTAVDSFDTLRSELLEGRNRYVIQRGAADALLERVRAFTVVREQERRSLCAALR